MKQSSTAEDITSKKAARTPVNRHKRHTSKQKTPCVDPGFRRNHDASPMLKESSPHIQAEAVAEEVAMCAGAVGHLRNEAAAALVVARAAISVASGVAVTRASAAVLANPVAVTTIDVGSKF